MLHLISRDLEYRQKNNRYLRNSFLVAVVLHLLFFYFFPPFEFKPYVLPNEKIIEIVYPEEFVIPPPPQEVTQPAVSIELAEEGEVVTNVDVPPTAFSSISELPAAPPVESTESIQKYYAFDEAPALIKAVRPVYPNIAKQAGIEGTVLLRLLIGEDGRVIEAEIIQSDVTPAMEEAAIAAARDFQFAPAKQRNVPVKAHVALPVIFEIQ